MREPPFLRRLELSPALRPGVRNPFESARKARAERLLRVGFQAASASTPGSSTEQLLDALRTPWSHKAIELVPIHGKAVRWLPNGHRFRMFTRRSGELEAASRSTDERGRRVLHLALVSGHERWAWVAREMGWGVDVTKLLELEALAAQGADLIVTEDAALIAARGHQFLRELNLMTPAEAAVVIGVWTRTIHEAFFLHVGVNNGLYYWSLARALTPAAWMSHCAFVRGERDLPDGREIVDLSGSILDHLKTMARGLDRLVATWQCESNNDTSDEILHEFVQLVIAAWSVHDNIALLAGRYLQIGLHPKHGPQWELAKKEWLSHMNARGATDGRAKAMVELVEASRLYIYMLRDLRNDFAHRALDRMTLISRPDGPRDARFVVKEELLAKVHDRLAGTSEGAAAWGFEPVIDFGDVEVTDVSTGETHIEAIGKRSYLDLVVFAARLLAYTARIADRTFAILDPISDGAIRDRERCVTSRPDWGSAEAAAAVIGFSPIAGLADTPPA